MPHHIVIKLPDNRVACADYRDPIAKTMHKVNYALAEAKPPNPELYARIAAWLDANTAQSALCHDSLSPARLGCGHD